MCLHTVLLPVLLWVLALLITCRARTCCIYSTDLWGMPIDWPELKCAQVPGCQ